jgi:cytochrome b
MMSTKVRVWDLPTRFFHWSLLVCVVALVTSAQFGGEAMVWHFRFGYAVLSLLLFRLIWGVVGGRWSRFASFLYSPAAILRYIKGQGPSRPSIGHNPLGAVSVFALMGFLLLQVGSGLISDDEIAATGPLSKFVSNATVNLATFYHKDIGKLILIGLVVLHVGAILFYQFKKGENLVRPMIGGDKETLIVTPGSRDDASSRTLATLILLGCVALVAWLVEQAG